MSILCIVLLCLFTCANTQDITFYVSSTAQSQQNNCTTPLTPCGNMQQVFSSQELNTSTNLLVNVMEGIYSGDLNTGLILPNIASITIQKYSPGLEEENIVQFNCDGSNLFEVNSKFTAINLTITNCNLITTNSQPLQIQLQDISFQSSSLNMNNTNAIIENSNFTSNSIIFGEEQISFNSYNNQFINSNISLLFTSNVQNTEYEEINNSYFESFIYIDTLEKSSSFSATINNCVFNSMNNIIWKWGVWNVNNVTIIGENINNENLVKVEVSEISIKNSIFDNNIQINGQSGIWEISNSNFLQNSHILYESSSSIHQANHYNLTFSITQKLNNNEEIYYAIKSQSANQNYLFSDIKIETISTGIYLDWESQANFTFENVVLKKLRNNDTISGTLVYLFARSVSSNSFISFSNCSFYDSFSDDNGAAIFMESSKKTQNIDLLIDRCLFSNCFANNGGAVYFYSLHNANILNSYVSGNNAVQYGGAFYIGGDGIVNLDGNFFENNVAEFGSILSCCGDHECSLSLLLDSSNSFNDSSSYYDQAFSCDNIEYQNSNSNSSNSSKSSSSSDTVKKGREYWWAWTLISVFTFFCFIIITIVAILIILKIRNRKVRFNAVPEENEDEDP